MKNGKDLRPRLADFPDVLTVEEAASLLRIGRNAAYQMVRTGALQSVKLGPRATRIAKPVLARLLGLEAEEPTRTAV